LRLRRQHSVPSRGSRAKSLVERHGGQGKASQGLSMREDRQGQHRFIQRARAPANVTRL
jgi:hypothetical protein